MFSEELFLRNILNYRERTSIPPFETGLLSTTKSIYLELFNRIDYNNVTIMILVLNSII